MTALRAVPPKGSLPLENTREERKMFRLPARTQTSGYVALIRIRESEREVDIPPGRLVVQLLGEL